MQQISFPERMTTLIIKTNPGVFFGVFLVQDTTEVFSVGGGKGFIFSVYTI